MYRTVRACIVLRNTGVLLRLEIADSRLGPTTPKEELILLLLTERGRTYLLLNSY